LQGRKVFKVFNQDFIVDERYTVTKELGQGAYGIVCAASNNQTGEGVAIKKVTNVFSKKILAKRALREIKLLQHFIGHRNITCLYDMDIPRPDNFNETYLYEGETTRQKFHLVYMLIPQLGRAYGVRSCSHHSLWPTSYRRPLPVLHLPDSVRPQIHPQR
jgi:serine/threonine protein kinase